MTDRQVVRRVTSGGRRLVEIVVAANAEDPWLAWTLPDERARRQLVSLFLRAVAFPHGMVLVAGDPPVGVAVLLPPEPEPPDPAVGEVVLALHGRLAGRALDADAIIDRHRPTTPRWALDTLAVDPVAQGRGVGSALLDSARAAAGPLAVETSRQRARSWYLARGFNETAAVVLSRGHGLGADAPTVWLLRDG